MDKYNYSDVQSHQTNMVYKFHCLNMVVDPDIQIIQQNNFYHHTLVYNHNSNQHGDQCKCHDHKVCKIIIFK